ncbi:MAG: hypothetical protein IKY27_00475 [Bacteroidales bacterium]|nr:hypothetical protein [Bacteroidales bacterium]MBR5780443.1 hypothetical protein [Bacteroidales bacterium]
MAKWFGKVGYGVTVETEPGVWEPKIVECEYFGEKLSSTVRKVQGSGGVNDNVRISNVISIIADPFAINNFSNIKYVSYMGILWKVEDVEIELPRLKMTMGEVWNGEQA